MLKFLSKKQILIFLIIMVLVISGAYFYSKREIQPIVVTTDPSDGATDVLETSQIDITFNSNIQEKAKADVSVSINPKVDFDSIWLPNTYKIIPKNNLTNNTKYTVNVLFKSHKTSSFSFDTTVFSQTDIKKYGPNQTQNDYAFGQATKKVVEQYPFYTSLPIETKDYVIFYDFQEQKFAITFLTGQTTDQQKTLIQEALVKIGQIGAKKPIQYYVNKSQP